MKYRQNLHTHSTFCDGKDAPESTVLRAIELGFDAIGFSGHSSQTGSVYAMDYQKLPDYKKEIFRLKDKYKDKIKVYCGLEEDLYNIDDTDGYEYVIGAVHYVKKDGERVAIDVSSANSLKEKVDKYFDGNYLKIAKEYYENICRLHTDLHHKMDFVAHFDIVAKFFETGDFIDQDNKIYRGYALDALHFLNSKGYPIEINTGGCSRGYRTIPYPAPFILKEFNKMGGRILITSDCHDNTKLDYMFDTSINLAKECGFKEVQIFDGKEFKPIPIM